MTNQGTTRVISSESIATESVLGKYTLIAELSRGGMGIIHLGAAHGPGGFNKLLAIKELKLDLVEEESYVVMFLEEARLAARLTHPNIVQTNEVGSEGQRHYMVMEFLDGRSLHRILRRFPQPGAFPVGAHLRVISEALLGLHYAHELKDFDEQQLGIVHRDVSPLNVFVTFDGQTKVIDFGIAKTADSSLETKTGILKGRVAYMSPEQAWGQRVDRRSDIFAAGAMLWEAAAGRRLWPGMSDAEILTRLLRDGAPPLRSARPDAPEELEAICARAMAKNREDRYSTAAELAEDLEAHLLLRDDMMTMREIGALIGGAFAEERRKTNAIIEETLSRVRSGPRSGVMPTFDLYAGTPSNGRIVQDDLRSASGQLLLSSSGSRVARPNIEAMSSPSFTGPAPVQKATATLRRYLPVAAACAGAMFVLSLALSAVFRPATSPATAGAPRANGPQATSNGHEETAASAAVPARELVAVSLRASPPSAQITIDGAAVSSNPFLARYPRDGQVHHVMAYADGFDAKWRDVLFTKDVSLDINLERRASPQQAVVRHYVAPQRADRVAATPSSPTVTSEPASAQPTAQPRTEVSTAGGRAPMHPIQTSNPYGAQ
jgi:serine/threonine protein kinase